MTLTPNELPIAEVGKPYHVRVFSDMNGRFYMPDFKEINGMNVDVIYEPPSYKTFFIIEGKPDKAGVNIFTISGSTPGTMCPGQQFEKEYKLITIDPKKDKNSQ